LIRKSFRDYRDLNNSGSIQDELQKAEKGGSPVKSNDFPDYKFNVPQEDSGREEQGFFDEDQ
jgi:hypothetical protein